MVSLVHQNIIIRIKYFKITRSGNKSSIWIILYLAGHRLF